MQLLGGLLTARIDEIGYKDQAGQADWTSLMGWPRMLKREKRQ